MRESTLGVVVQIIWFEFPLINDGVWFAMFDAKSVDDEAMDNDGDDDDEYDDDDNDENDDGDDEVL
jgi:hypothetical protein